MKTTYRILEGQPIDSNSAKPYWIEEIREDRFLFTKRRVFGDYTMDDTYGKLGDCPFFSREKGVEPMTM